MNKIKSMLIKASNEQKIPELQDEILRKVDTSKVVRLESLVKTNYRRRFALSNIIAMTSIAAASILIGIGIGNIGKNNNQVNNDINNTNNLPPEVINENTNAIEESSELFSSYMDSIFKQECFNIVNIAPSLDNISFDSATIEGSRMTQSEMDVLAHDFNSNINVLEDMLGKINKENCLISDNLDPNYNYSKVIDVYGLNDYKIYYNEEILDRITVDGNLYKSRSNLEGLIVIGNKNYEFSGSMVYKNSTTTYTTTIIKGDNKIEIEEVFKQYQYRYTYTYSKVSDENISKTIIINQKLNYNFNTEEIEFTNGYTKTVIQTKNQKDNMHIFVKIKSRDSDELYIYKLDNGYKYKFKNSESDGIILLK